MENIVLENIYEILGRDFDPNEPLPTKAAKALREYVMLHGLPPHLEVVIDGEVVKVKEFQMEKSE